MIQREIQIRVGSRMSHTGERGKCHFDRVAFEGRRDGAGEHHGFVVKYQKTVRMFGLESSSHVDVRRRSKISPPGKKARKVEVDRFAGSDSQIIERLR